MKNIFFITFLILSFLIIGTPHNLSDVKKNACKTWQQIGYECIGYGGYKFGTWLGFGYGGAKVWHTLKRPGNNIIYSGYVQKWGNEYHIYGPKAIDAIKGQ